MYGWMDACMYVCMCVFVYSYAIFDSVKPDQVLCVLPHACVRLWCVSVCGSFSGEISQVWACDAREAGARDWTHTSDPQTSA